MSDSASNKGKSSQAVNFADFDLDFSAPADWARMYRSFGVQAVRAISPMREPSHKRPALANWREFQNELVPDSVFEKWFPNNAPPNMGMITGAASGGILCVDLDDYKNAGASAWFSDVMGPDPETWTQRTGGGGRQVFFRLPEGVSLPNGKSAALGVDIRCQGGFAMLPPSQHLSGGVYKWLDGFAPWECELAVAPGRLIEAIREITGAAPNSAGLITPAQLPNSLTARPNSVNTPQPATATDPFGAVVDGREEYMTRVVWAAVVDMYRESPIFAPSDSQEAV